MAMGILMSRRGPTEEAAFAVLTEVSQRSNREIRDLAEGVVLSGDL